MSDIVEEKSIQVTRKMCDWCGKTSDGKMSSIYARGNYAERWVLPWWKNPVEMFVGFFIDERDRENKYRYDVHVGCVEEIVDKAIEGKREKNDKSR